MVVLLRGLIPSPLLPVFHWYFCLPPGSVLDHEMEHYSPDFWLWHSHSIFHWRPSQHCWLDSWCNAPTKPISAFPWEYVHNTFPFLKLWEFVRWECLWLCLLLWVPSIFLEERTSENFCYIYIPALIHTLTLAKLCIQEYQKDFHQMLFILCPLIPALMSVTVSFFS